jgi:hypothetical protein
MINARMRLHDYYLIDGVDDYGQDTVSKDVQGQIKMAVSIISQSVQDNILYSGCEYVGLTHDANVNDKYIVVYEGQRLKVLYVNPHGRFKQVFMSKVG